MRLRAKIPNSRGMGHCPKMVKISPGRVHCLTLLHGSETWAPTAPNLQRLRRNDRAMIRWICRVKPHDKIPMETLYIKLRIQEVAVALRTKCLRWYGHAACYGVGLLRVSEYSDIRGSKYKIGYEYSSLPKSLDRDFFFFFFNN